MDRELLIELGCEEIPASWLAPLTRQFGEHIAARLSTFRLPADGPVETFSTPRRLTVRVARIPERQTDLEDLVMGPPVAAAFTASGEPTPAASGFAKKQGVEVAALERAQTPKGTYLAFRKRQRGKAAVDVLPDVLAAALRDMTFPKQMRWDAWLDDGRGELLFGRPIRWILFLYGGRVVPFTIRRTELAQSSLVQEVRSAAVTYGHRFLATSGRSGRAIKVRSFDEYRARLIENFVVLDHSERHNKIARELDAHARRLGGRVSPAASTRSSLLDEVPDLVEYPSVVAGTFAPEFLELPEEVLTTTMIHHQHYFPVVNAAGRLMPAFLAVVNTEPDNGRTIARNAERVLTARLRDARFFWDADRRVRLEDRLARLDTVLFHKALGTYRAKADRLEHLAGWMAGEIFPGDGATRRHAAQAGRLAKADLTTDMVRELTELQGTMGGIYARLEGLPEQVWRAIYFQYLPQSVEPGAPPSREDLGQAAASWVAVSLADKLDTLAGLFLAGERPTGTRDPFGLRRQAHGALRILMDLPELVGVTTAPSLEQLVKGKAVSLLPEMPPARGQETVGVDERREASLVALAAFLRDRLKYLLEQRGYNYDEINAVVGPAEAGWAGLNPLDARQRLEALRAIRGSADFEALAVAFKRVKNLAKELAGGPVDTLDLITEPAERALLEEYETRGASLRSALVSRDYAAAFRTASGFRPAIDRFFTDVFVMVDDRRLRDQRLTLVWRLHELLLELADVSEIVPRAEVAS